MPFRRSLIMFALLVVLLVASFGRAESSDFVLRQGTALADTPVSFAFQPAERIDAARLAVVEIDSNGAETGTPIPAQLDAGRIWWIVPDVAQRERRFRPAQLKSDAPAAFTCDVDQEKQYYTLLEGELPVLRYNFGVVPLPEGRQPHRFGDGRLYGGDRSDYIHPLYGLKGETLTEDYPGDHPHHRGLWWSWPVVRYKDRVADIWAVCDVWARPESIQKVQTGPVMAILRAVNVWKFGEAATPIVREEVVLRIFRVGATGRVIDIDLTLTGIEDGVAIGGRPHGGYGGLTLRAVSAPDRKITPHVDPAPAQPRRAWCDYTARFDGADRPTGIMIIQHASNPDYPSNYNIYANINCFMPAFPGPREFPLKKGEPVTLRHRVWIHPGETDEKAAESIWDAYNQANEAGR